MLKRKTLRFQIYLTIAMIFPLIAIFFGVILYPFENQRQKTVIRKVEFLINSIVMLKGEAIANELFLKHREAVEIIIKKMLEIEGVIAIGIYDENGKLFVATSENFNDEITDSERQSVLQAYSFIEGTWNHQKVVTYTGPIIVIGETLGFLKIHYSLADVVKETHLTLIIFIALFLTILLSTALLLNILLTRFVIRPTDMLITAMRKLQNGHLGEQVDIDLNNEIGEMSETFNQMSYENALMYDELNELNKNLEQKVAERTFELQQKNKNITDSIQYARKIQMALLPDRDEIKLFLPKSFFIWKPRDIVGGDIFFTSFFKHGFILAMIDCTGHGVPGAFMTMIVVSALRRIVRDEGCHDPAEILKRLNYIVKTTLQQDTEHAVSDDGLDAGICFVSQESGDRIQESGVRSQESEYRSQESEYKSQQPTANSQQLSTSHFSLLTFAGAKLPLYYVQDGEVNIIKGDRKSIGYKRSDTEFDFTNHTIQIKKGVRFYMATDGYTDQIGGEEDRSFGKKQLVRLLGKISHIPFEYQREEILRVFYAYKGENEQLDDVTVAGFGF